LPEEAGDADHRADVPFRKTNQYRHRVPIRTHAKSIGTLTAASLVPPRLPILPSARQASIST
jgi:hypothetical protein